jgi:hypothetical protein
MASTVESTKLEDLLLLTDIPPSHLKKKPNGGLNKVCLAINCTFNPIAALKNIPSRKSQFVVCGATTKIFLLEANAFSGRVTLKPKYSLSMNVKNGDFFIKNALMR